MSELILENKKELPQGWTETTLDDISWITLGQSPPSTTYNEDKNGLPFYQGKKEFGGMYPTPKVWCSKPNKIAEKNDVLICVRAPVGPTNLCPEKSGIGRGLSSIRGLGGINYLFVLYLLRSKEWVISRKGKGTTFNAITGPFLRSISVMLPPLEEQQRIVSKIEELFSDIEINVELLKKTNIQLNQYKQSLLKTSFDLSVPKEILDDCGDVGTGGTPSRKKSEYYTGKIRWVKTAEVKNYHIKDTKEKITQLALDNSNAKIYPKNSVILAMYGEGKTRGRSAILDVPASTNQACAVIVCNPKKLFYKFCFYWFQSQYQQVRSKSSGGNQPNLNLGIVKKLQIPLPDFPTQKQIVDNIESGLSQVNFLQKSNEKNLQDLGNLKNSILKQTFEGKLVPQDFKDEPASVLLEKIKKEKEIYETSLKIKSKKSFKRRRKKNAR